MSNNYLTLDDNGNIAERLFPTSLGSFVFQQSSPATVWTINHNLNKFPSVTVRDSAGSIIWGDVDYVSANQVTVTFTAGFSGSAYLV